MRSILTALVLAVSLTAPAVAADVKKGNPSIDKGLTWLRSNQATTGEWRGVSVNKKRDPATHVGALSLVVECSRGGFGLHPSRLLQPFAWFNPPAIQQVVAPLVDALVPYVRGAAL